MLVIDYNELVDAILFDDDNDKHDWIFEILDDLPLYNLEDSYVH